MNLPADQRVLAGRFRLDSVLGQGGMGTVYAATDVSINRQVAIKLLRPDVTDDPVALERLREEAVSLASLRHPNVVQLYDFYASGPDSTFLLMELIEGQSLAARLHRQGPLPVALAVDYVRQVLSALAAAHAKGIIHRDIKPGNVLVVSVPMQRDLIKVLDFGIAKLTEETIRRRPTTAGVLLGTPSYMSPEQATGRPLDARSDIYAAALLLYTLLAGKNPFSGLDDVAATLVRVQSVMPVPINQVRPDVPAALSEVIAVAMAKNPNERFQTAAELVGALDWAITGGTDVTQSKRVIAPARTSSRPAEPTTSAATWPMASPPSGALVAPFDDRSVSVSVSHRTNADAARPRRKMSRGMLVFLVAIVMFGTVVLASIGLITYLVGNFVTAIATTPPPNAPQFAGGGLEGFPCTSDANCDRTMACLHDEPGCSAPRHCQKRAAAPRCDVAVPMCACADHRSFDGPGGCAGLASEPWEPYPCACNVDADCGGGQRCVPITPGKPHRPGAARECRPR